MDFIQKNANTKLLFLLLLIALGIVTLTILYQENFKNINTEYQNKVQLLNQTFNELTQTKTAINQTEEELQLKAQREQDLSTQFTGLKDTHKKTITERDELADEKTQLDKQLLDTKRQLAQTLKENGDFQDQIKSLKDSIRSKLDQLDSQQAEINRLKSEGCT